MLFQMQNEKKNGSYFCKSHLGFLLSQNEVDVNIELDLDKQYIVITKYSLHLLVIPPFFV